MGCVFMLKYLEDPETRQRRIQNFQYITNIGIESCLQILENLAEVPRPSQMAFVNNCEATKPNKNIPSCEMSKFTVTAGPTLYCS